MSEENPKQQKEQPPSGGGDPQLNWRGLSFEMKSRPSDKSWISFLSRASDKLVIEVTLQRSWVMKLEPNVICPETEEVVGCANEPIMILCEPFVRLKPASLPITVFALPLVL